MTICAALKLSGICSHLFEKDYYTAFEYPYSGNITQCVYQLQANKVPDVAPINFYNYSFISNCYSKCHNNGNQISLRLVYLIKSAPENFERRIVIRKTWGYEKRYSDVEIRTVFLLGVKQNMEFQSQIVKESQEFGDIIQAEFVDAYFNNTIKTMIGLKWAVNFCSQSRFYMFVDDDYYVSTKNVLNFLHNPIEYPSYLELEQLYDLPEDVQLYAGYVFKSAPHRHFTSKWYVSLHEYPYHLWPPYVTAGAYILTKTALVHMYYASFYVRHFRFDDVYMGLLAKKAEIEPFHSDYFHFYKKFYNKSNYKFIIASHGYASMEELSNVWIEQKSLGNA